MTVLWRREQLLDRHRGEQHVQLAAEPLKGSQLRSRRRAVRSVVVMRMTLSILPLAVLAVLVVGACGSTKAKAVSGSCGPDYVFIANGHRQSQPNCGGTLPEPVSKSVKVGQRLSIVIATNASDGSLAYPVPMPPRGAAVRFEGRSGARAFYLAKHKGVALLWARHTRLCPELNPKLGSCVVYRVTVTARNS